MNPGGQKRSLARRTCYDSGVPNLQFGRKKPSFSAPNRQHIVGIRLVVVVHVAVVQIHVPGVGRIVCIGLIRPLFPIFFELATTRILFSQD